MNCYIGLVFAVSALVSAVTGLAVTVSPSADQYVQPEGKLQLVCELDQTLQFIIKGKLGWYFKPAQEGAVEVHITDQGNKVIADPNYKFEFDSTAMLLAKLTILTIDENNNGEYICRAEEGQVTKQKRVKLVVIKPVSHVELQIDNKPAIIGDEMAPYEEDVRPGKTAIMCIAHGSFPKAKVHFYIGETHYEPEAMNNLQELQPLSYKSSITIRTRLLPMDNGKKMRCVANVDLPKNVHQFDDVKSSIPLHIITLVPMITCSNTTASLNDKYVKLICDVSSARPIKRLYWELGYNSQILYPGNKTEDMTEVRVEKVQGNDESKKVILDIYNLKQKHLDSIFYLIVESSDGSIYKEPVYVREFSSGSSGLRSVGLLTVLGLLVRWLC